MSKTIGELPLISGDIDNAELEVEFNGSSGKILASQIKGSGGGTDLSDYTGGFNISGTGGAVIDRTGELYFNARSGDVGINSVDGDVILQASKNIQVIGNNGMVTVASGGGSLAIKSSNGRVEIKSPDRIYIGDVDDEENAGLITVQPNLVQLNSSEVSIFAKTLSYMGEEFIGRNDEGEAHLTGLFNDGIRLFGNKFQYNNRDVATVNDIPDTSSFVVNGVNSSNLNIKSPSGASYVNATNTLVNIASGGALILNSGTGGTVVSSAGTNAGTTVRASSSSGAVYSLCNLSNGMAELKVQTGTVSLGGIRGTTDNVSVEAQSIGTGNITLKHNYNGDYNYRMVIDQKSAGLFKTTSLGESGIEINSETITISAPASDGYLQLNVARVECPQLPTATTATDNAFVWLSTTTNGNWTKMSKEDFKTWLGI